MQCYPHVLQQQLNSKIAPVYLLFGNESFLIEESATLIREKIRSQEVDYYKINQSEQRDWLSSFKNTNGQSSLWSKGQCYEILFPAKISAGDVSCLTSLFEEDLPETYLILKIGSLTRQQQQAKWFTKIQQIGVTVPHWSIPLHAFSKWVSLRAASHGLQLTSDQLNNIVAHTEGNALAAAQEIERLTLYMLDASSASSSLSQQSQYEVFDLIIAAVNQQSERLLKVLVSLKEISAIPLPLLLWTLSSSLRAFLNCAYQPSINHQRLFKQAGIRESVYAQYAQASQTIQPALCTELLSRLTKIDQNLKTGEETFAWEQITDILIALSTREY